MFQQVYDTKCELLGEYVLRDFIKAFRVFTKTNYFLRKAKKHPNNSLQFKDLWVQKILSHLNVKISLKGSATLQSPCIFVGNHISYLDIPIVMSLIHNAHFLSKSEIRYWPVIGSGAKFIGTLFVKRNSTESRAQVREQIKEYLYENKRIIVFPSGTTNMSTSSEWRRGIFEIAKDLNIPMQPFRISYSPMREVAYIDKDFFPLHLFKLVKHDLISCNFEFSPPITILNVNDELYNIKKWCEEKYHEV